VGFADVPSFGWALVLRLDSAPISGAQSQFANFMLLGGGLVALAAILAMALVFGALLRPLNSLIDAISRLSKGEEVGFVAGSMQYREAARLTNALARFQTKDADRRQHRRPSFESPQ
jgi:nitrogen fixation/metabolism regulation signal transduction histidine kinase